MKKVLNALLILILLVSVSFAADRFEQGTTSITNTFTGVTYTGAITFGTGTDSYHTKPIFIGDCNYLDGNITTSFTTGYDTDSDVIVSYHYSNDLINWVTTADAVDMDLDANQYQSDSLGIDQGVDDLPFHSKNWMIIEFAGQTGNDDDQVLKWSVKLRTEEPLHNNGQPIPYGRIANRATTNP